MRPSVWAHFRTHEHNLSNLVEVYFVMLHTKYQGSMPCGFRQEDVFTFPYISLCKICDTRGGPMFGPRDIIWTNLVEFY